MIEKENIPQLVDDLLARRLRLPTPEFDLQTFKELYHEISKRRGNVQQYMYVIILGKEAYCQFSEIFNQHYLVLHSERLSEDEFDFSSDVVCKGAKDKPPKFYEFILSEAKMNWKALFSIFCLGCLFLWLSWSVEFIQWVNEMLITSATLFFSIYLLFTVTQNTLLYKDLLLFLDGIVSKYFTDDRLLATTSVFSIPVALVGASAARIEYSISVSVLRQSFQIEVHKVVSVLVTSLALSILANCFLAVIDYYIERNKDMIERNLSTEALAADFQKHHRDERDKGTA